ncbi:MAG: T9SS type A sorting domain-containing protein [Saprospiraceae bacterium]|nr:T9SS type A sorting domain-containing protein [Saprospiraceae bacterium]
MTRTPDGHYLVAGRRTAYGDLAQPSGGDWGGWLYKFTEQGDSLWSRADNAPAPHVPGGEFAYGGVGILSSGSVVAGGLGTLSTQFVGWVVKVTADGCMDTVFCAAVGAGEPPSRVLDASLLSIAPNPARATVSLALEGEAVGDRPVRFSIHNLLGQEVWSARSASGREEVWLSGWPAGAYIARAESARGVAARVFVKE